MDLEQLNSFEEVLNRVMQTFGIEAKELAVRSGISEAHISAFRNGKLKRGFTSKALWDLLDGMEKIEPESRKYFCRLLNTKNPNMGREELENYEFEEVMGHLIDVASPEQVDLIMLKISSKLRQRTKAKASNSTYRAKKLLGIS